MSYTPRSQSRPLPARGAPSSTELRAKQDQMITDILGVARVANANEAAIEQLKTIIFNEIRALKSSTSAFWELQGKNAEANARAVGSGLPFIYINTLSDTTDAYQHPGTPPEHRATINNDTRLLVPPKNNALSLFYDLPSDRPGEIVSREPTVDVLATAEFDGIVTSGSPLNAFNGNNTSFWLRKVSFPLHHDVVEVEMEVIVDVPTSNKDANTVQLIPFPFNSITIKDVQYTTDSGEGWQTIAKLSNLFGYDDTQGVRHFTPIKNLEPIQIMVPDTPIRRLKLIVSQDNWIEENGRKVFYYGFQEVGLFFIEWESTRNTADPFNEAENNNMLFRVDAPDGFKFTALTFFDSYPYDGTSSDPALLWQVGTDQYDFGPAKQKWTSLTPTPQAGSVVTLDDTSIFVKAVLNMATQDSPFPMGTPAFVQSFMAHLSLQADI